MKCTFWVVFAVCYAKYYVDADCEVISKKEWGGRSPSKVEYLPRPTEIVIIQHTMTPYCNSDGLCKDRVKNIQDDHMDNRRYWDIGPSFLVGGNAKVYEGSGWLHVGAHSYGYNRIAIAITFIGNYDDLEPTIEALEAAKDLIKCGVQQGHLTADYKLVGHKQLLATDSPGRHVYDEIRTWPHWQENVDDIKLI